MIPDFLSVGEKNDRLICVWKQSFVSAAENRKITAGKEEFT